MSEKASTKWQLLLAEEPDNELLRFTLAKALLDEESYAEAATHFDLLTSAKPDYALAWAFLARARLLAGDHAGARKACELGLPPARAQCHDIPLEEIQAVLDELDQEF